MHFLIRPLITIFLASMMISCSSSACTEINPEDIPIYPNARDIKQAEPTIDGGELYTWSFTTTDNPEEVWQFYKDKMINQWNGVDHSVPQSTEKDVMIKGCLFYYFTLNSTSVDDTMYNITIQFSREAYR